MSKTNFDAWKETLTPQDLILPRVSDSTKCVWISCERNCPAAATCPARKAFPKNIRRCKAFPKNIQRWGHFAKRCDKWFLRWAKAEAKEEK